MKMERDPSESPPSQRSYSPPISPKPAVILRKKTLGMKSAVASIPALPKDNSSLSEKMENLKKSQQQLLDWQSEGGDFIPLSGCADSGYQGSLVLEDEINKFLSDQRKTVMLLAGNSGAGKSLFTQGFVSKLWAQYKEGDPIPIWISLPNCKDPETKAIEETLLKAGFDHEQIAALRVKHRLIFIFDAYDEIRSSKNLWVTNNLGQWNAKIIFTCRHEYLYWMENFKNLFTPIVDDRLDYEASQVLYVKPLSPEQIEGYVRRYIQRHKTLWRRWEDYQRGFEEIPGLKELIQTPYVLKLAVEALPEIMRCYEGVETEKKKDLTKAVLYDVFVDQWFARQERKLKDNGVISEEEPIREEFWNYAISLASMMHQRQIVQVLYEPSEADIFDIDAKIADENPFSRFFDSSLPKVPLFQTSCFIKRTGLNHFAFEHASLFDFFVSKGISDDSLNNARDNRRRTIYQPKEEAINVALCTEAQINLLAERVKESDEFKQYLLGTLYSSRNNPRNVFASANAITVLVKAGVTFNGADLSYLYLRGANISGGYFDRANLEGTDLQNVIMHRVWLQQANLQKSNLKGVDFGEHPWIEHDDAVYGMLFSEELNRIVTASGNKISIWNVIIKKCIKQVETRYKISCIDMSQDGKIIACFRENNEVFICSTSKDEVEYIKYDCNPSCVSISSNGKTFVVGFEDGTIHIVDLVNQKSKKMKDFDEKVQNVDANSDGNVIVTSSYNAIHVLNLDEKKSIVKHTSNTIRCIKVNSKGTRILYTDGAVIKELDFVSGESTEYLGHENDVYCLNFSNDEKRIISGDSNTVRIWNCFDNQARLLYGHQSTISSVAITNYGQNVLSSSWDGTVRFWNISSARSVKTPSNNEKISTLRFSGQKLLMLTEDGKIMIFDNEKEKSIEIYKSLAFVDSNIGSDAKILLFLHMFEGKVEVFTVANNQSIILDVENHITCNWLSADSQLVVLGCDERIFLYNLATRKKINVGIHDSTLQCVSCNSTGTIVGAGDANGRFTIWDLKKKKKTVLENAAVGYATALCMSIDGKIIVCAYLERKDQDLEYKIRMHHMTDRSYLDLFGHEDTINCVEISVDNDVIVSGSSDNTVRIWDVKSGLQKAMIFVNHAIMYISLEDNMRFFAVKLNHGSPQLWERMNDDGSVWQLKWTSDFRRSNNFLNLAAIDAKECNGLSWINQQLFSQRKAILKEANLANVAKQNRSPIHQGRNQNEPRKSSSTLKSEVNDSQITHGDKCVLC